MKKNRFFSLIVLALAATMLLSACGTTPTETATQPATGEVTATGEENEQKTLNIANPKKALEAIPVASSDMSIDQLREIAANYMRLQTSIPWVPAKDYSYVMTTSGKNETFKQNVIYGGMPYTHNSGSLYAFLDFYDAETGVLNLPNASYIGEVIGNDCADAVFWGWARFSTTINFTLTRYMQQSKGALRVGSYTYDDSIKDFADYYTTTICKDNGEQTMFRSYAEIQMGDGFVMCNKGGQGHAIMAASKPVVVYNDDGTINPDQSYVFILEQHSNQVERPLSANNESIQNMIDGTVYEAKEVDFSSKNDSVVHNISGVDNKFTFTKLFKTGYLPITCAELRGTKAIEKATVSCEVQPEAAVDNDALNAIVVVSNYRVAKISTVITDADGKVVYETTSYNKDNNTNESVLTSMQVSVSKAAINRMKLDKNATYNVSITALVSSGETLPVYSGTYLV